MIEGTAESGVVLKALLSLSLSLSLSFSFSFSLSLFLTLFPPSPNTDILVVHGTRLQMETRVPHLRLHLQSVTIKTAMMEKEVMSRLSTTVSVWLVSY